MNWRCHAYQQDNLEVASADGVMYNDDDDQGGVQRRWLSPKGSAAESLLTATSTANVTADIQAIAALSSKTSVPPKMPLTGLAADAHRLDSEGKKCACFSGSEYFPLKHTHFTSVFWN